MKAAAGAAFTITQRLCVAAYGFLISEKETIPPSGPACARRRSQSTVPAGYRPRGSPAAVTTPHAEFHRNAAYPSRAHADVVLPRCPCCGSTVERPSSRTSDAVGLKIAVIHLPPVLVPGLSYAGQQSRPASLTLSPDIQLFGPPWSSQYCQGLDKPLRQAFDIGLVSNPPERIMNIKKSKFFGLAAAANIRFVVTKFE